MNLQHIPMTNLIWLGIGFGAQALFSMRFIIQWITSEYKKRSVIPTAFWYFSIAGSLGLLGYAIHRHDPVIITGQLMGVIIYSRNLLLIYRHKQNSGQTSNENP